MKALLFIIALHPRLGLAAPESGILTKVSQAVRAQLLDECDGGVCDSKDALSMMQSRVDGVASKSAIGVEAADDSLHTRESAQADEVIDANGSASKDDNASAGTELADTTVLTNESAVQDPEVPAEEPVVADPVVPAEEPATAKDTNGAIETTAACGWLALVVGLLLLASVVSKHVPAEPDKSRLSSQYSAEFLGTFMLIFSVGCNVLVGDATWGVVAIACTLMVSIYALGGVSGGNFNPAVSICLGCAGKMGWAKVIVYVLVQLAAGVFAGLAYGLMLGKTFNLAPTDGFSGLQAGLAELFYTFMLTFCVLNTACSKAHAGKNQFYGLAIGFSVIAGGYAGGSISGGCFNPAVALGIDASSSAFGFGWCVFYWAFEILGCIIAAGLFKICRPDDNDGKSDIADPTLSSKLVSEFLGTFMLVLTVGLNVLGHSKAAVFSIAASLMCMIFALGSVSGANFNPAVTVAIAFSGRGVLKTQEVFTYIIVQIVAGVCAALTYSTMQNGKTVALEPSDSFSQAMIGETVFTFLLAYVVLAVATTKAPLSEYFGLAIGSCVTAGGLAIGSLSGGSLNPAVSAGLAFTHGGTSIGNFLAYSAAEVSAGVIAASIFRYTHHLEYTDLK